MVESWKVNIPVEKELTVSLLETKQIFRFLKEIKDNKSIKEHDQLKVCMSLQLITKRIQKSKCAKSEIKNSIVKDDVLGLKTDAEFKLLDHLVRIEDV
jgi:hypothetical protein